MDGKSHYALMQLRWRSRKHSHGVLVSGGTEFQDGMLGNVYHL